MTEEKEQKDVFGYLPYVTLSQVWKGLRSQCVAWLLLSAVVLAIGFLGKWVIDLTGTFWSSIPLPLLVIAGVAALTWFKRDESSHLVCPTSFQGWLLTNLDIAAFVIAVIYLPFVVMVPVYLGFALLLVALEDLSAVGKSNYLERPPGRHPVGFNTSGA